MSRGPGRWQRVILDAVARHSDGVFLTAPSDTRAEAVAIRRAARTLAAADRVRVRMEPVSGGRPRLVAYRFNPCAPSGVLAAGSPQVGA